MVKHNQLDVKGAPWKIKGGGGAEELVSQAGDIFLLGFSSQFPTVTGLGLGQAHLLVPRFLDKASYKWLILRSWPLDHLLP